MTSTTGNQRMIKIGSCLSLSGRYAKFGRQAAQGLEAWKALDGSADLIVEDDESDRQVLEAKIHRVANSCDVLLGPYSTQLIRSAGQVAAKEGWLLWNHGGSGDNVQSAHPGYMVSVLTPTSNYASPFIQHSSKMHDTTPLKISQGKGSFGRQVAEGAEKAAQESGINTVRGTPSEVFASVDSSSEWNLFSAGTFEDDITTVKEAQAHENPPRRTCAVAAGVRDFSKEINNTNDIFGVAQWFPNGMRTQPFIGPIESEFLAQYAKAAGTQTPDYPAVQAVACAALAAHCVRQAESNERTNVWEAARNLDTTTLFGAFNINSTNGVQLGHEMSLVQWTPEGLFVAR